MLHISRACLGPPKAPRNCFFPWFNFVLVRSGAYLEPNRIAFRVPVHVTKPEIREYLRKIYDTKVIKVNTYIHIPKIKRNTFGDFIKQGGIYKKAIVTCEEVIPDEVKMFVNSRKPRMNPAITKYDTPKWIARKKWWSKNTVRPGVNRSMDWLPRHPQAHAEVIPTLLRGDDFPPPLPKTEKMEPQRHLPHLHQGGPFLPDGVPQQIFPRPDLTVLRGRHEAARRSRTSNSDGVHVPAEMRINERVD
ncbi:unnamed protein product [Amoebophrya sp. A25]|nr:unnamed protein product [Amoebophrya sp. A25]|eukprot:GSA25T00015279001.1